MERRKAVTRVVQPADDTAGKKGQRQQAAPAVLPAEAYTTGGVKKTKFEPKVPTRRVKKLSATVKDEPGEGSGEVPKELQRLLQQAENDGQRAFRPNQRTSKVAFGFGGFSSRTSLPSAGFQHKGSSRGGGGGSGGGGGGGGGGGSGGGSSRGVLKEEFMQADEIHFKEGARKNVEVFDLERYFPVTLPLRKPFSGDARLLDDEEFGDEDEVHDNDEDAVEPAEELGLTEKKEDDMLFFFQLPQGLPLSKSTPGSAKLEDLTKGGAMGKLLVYESGVVKFKVGDVILDALPGTECTFAQELAAVNTTTKRCGFLGEVYKRIVLTPDINNVLPDITNLST